MSTFQVTTAKPADVQISNDGRTVYTSSDDGYLRAYSTATGALIHAWHIGTDLGAMDLSPDGTFMMVVEDTPVSQTDHPNDYPTYTVAAYKVDLSTGSAHTYLYNTGSNFDDYTFADIGVLNSGQVLLTQRIFPGWSGWTTPKLLDLTTGSFTDQGRIISQDSWLTPVPDGSKALLGEADISNAQLDLYTRGSGITASTSGSSFNYGAQAISMDGALIAQTTTNSTNIYDGALHLVANLDALHPEWQNGNVLGMTFDAAHDFLYVLNTGTDTIDKVSTIDWHTVATIPLGFEAGAWPGYFYGSDDAVLLDPTGHFFTVNSPSGLQIVSNPGAGPITGTEGDDDISGTVGNDTINGLGGDDFIGAGAGDDVVHGGAGFDVLYGEAGNDTLYGDADDDILHGDAGNDQLYGGDGNDYLRGGAGVDSYDGGADTGVNPSTLVGDQLSFFEAGATQGAVADLRTNIVYNDGFGNSETMTGIESLGAGTAYADTFFGNDNANGLMGETGDKLYGIGGDDFLMLRGAAAIADGGDGIDMLTLSAAGQFYQPGAGGPGTVVMAPAMTAGWTVNLEGQTLRDGYGNTGIVYNIENVTGSALGDFIQGSQGANLLDGSGGDDNIYGLDGADTINGGDGNDVLNAGIFGDPYAGAAVPTYLLTFDPGRDVDTLNGGAGDDIISAGYGDNVDGGSGTDSLMLSLMGALSGVTVDFTPLASGGSISVGGGTITGIERVGNVEGSAYADVIDAHAVGGAVLYGRGGNDVIKAGATTFAVWGGDGDDVIDATAATYQYASYFYGEAGNDLLIGGLGTEVLNGGAGNDTYRIYDSRVTVAEDANAGTDEVQTSLASYTLGFNVENLTGLSATGQTLTGNDLDNVIRGGTGADTMAGGKGNDVYYVDSDQDSVTEQAGEGTDEVRFTTYGYILGANVENLTGLSATGQFLVGNALDNVIAAGDANDAIIASSGGSDHVYANGGNDSIDFGAAFDASDVVDGGAGADELALAGVYNNLVLGANVRNIERLNLRSHDAYVDHSPIPNQYTIVAGDFVSATGQLEIAGAGLAANETLSFDGSARSDVAFTVSGGRGDDSIKGGGLADTIDGQFGADTMAGGNGDDLYTVDNVGDLVVEQAGEGKDTVRTTLAAYTLTANVENLGGSDTAQTLTGNGLDNWIAGLGGDDVLDGAGGWDRLNGGDGNDRLLVSLPGRVLAYGDAGTDTLVVDYSQTTGRVTTLLTYSETGDGPAYGYSDGLGRSVSFFDVEKIDITTGEGNDDVKTGAGDDRATLNGGDDIVHLDAGNDTAFGGAGTDTLYGEAGDDVLDGGTGADTMTGGTGNDVYYVDDANDIVIENAGEGTDEVRTTIANYVLPANVEKLTYVGTGNWTFTGGTGNDNVAASDGNDFFDLSQGGADKASGGGGTDAFSFGAAFGAGDSVDGGAGADTVGIRGDYTGANKLTITAGQLVNVETLSIMTSLGGPVGYDITWSDGNLATNQKMAIYAGNLQAGENVTFDGSAETHGYFVMYGGLGTDNLKGGSSSDGFYFGPGKFTQADHVDGGGGGQNQLGLDGSYDFSSSSALGTFGGNFANIQTIVLYAGDPVYNIVTNDAAVAAGKLLTIFGTPVVTNLVFDGSAETDGSFRILSGTGDDTLTGGHGNDTLYGNLGADTLTGGAGNDVFLYTDAAQSTAAKTDHILEFDAGDKIDLSQIDADSTQAGDQAFAWIGANAFGHHAGELRADLANGVWTVQGDLDGDGTADFTLLVTTANNHPLVNTDFVL